jgi:LacI family transcriptional regulator
VKENVSVTMEKRARGVTIIDVAKRVGVSPMTVSRVINSNAGVRQATRDAVAAAIRELGYTPNLAARSLVTSREVRIGVIYSNPSAGFMSEFLLGVFEEASACAATLILLRGQSNRPPTSQQIEALIASGVTGMILAPPLGESTVVREALRRAGIPAAIVGGTARDAISVSIDDRCAAYDVTRHLIDLGHRRLGFIIGNPDQSASAERLSGFHAAVREAGSVEIHVAQGDFSYASGLAAGETLLDLPSAPTAILASNDDMAAAVISVAHRRHLRVPDDLSVAGFDDTTTATTLWPPLTTVRQPVHTMATIALQMLIRGVQAPSSDQKPLRRPKVLKHELVKRESTAPPPRVTQ